MIRISSGLPFRHGSRRYMTRLSVQQQIKRCNRFWITIQPLRHKGTKIKKVKLMSNLCVPGPDPWPRPGMQGLGLEPSIPVYLRNRIICLCRRARAGWFAWFIARDFTYGLLRRQQHITCKSRQGGLGARPASQGFSRGGRVFVAEHSIKTLTRAVAEM